MISKILKKNILFLIIFFAIFIQNQKLIAADEAEFNKILSSSIRKLDLIQNKTFPRGLPEACETSLDFIQEEFDFNLSEEAKLILKTLYRYEMPRDMAIFSPVQLRKENNSQLHEQITYTRHQRGVDKDVLAFAEEGGSYWCFVWNEGSLKIAFYSTGLHGETSKQLEGPYTVGEWLNELTGD